MTSALLAYLFFSLFITINSQSVSTTSGRYDFQQNDINTLNFALTLEYLELNFYEVGLRNFTQQQFADAGYNSTVYAYIQLIRDHEQTHVTTLTQAIQARGGVATTSCQYNFPLIYGPSIPAFIRLASVLENTGVNAYDGAVQTLTDIDLIAASATIATIEARHAALLNELVGINPWNNIAFDIAVSPAEIIAAAAAYITDCSSTPAPFPPIVPLPAEFPFNNITNATAERANDIKTLQFALFFETLEVSFYTYGLSVLSPQDFLNAGYNDSIYTTEAEIRDLERAHQTFITNTLIGIGGQIPGTCNYTFPALLAQYTTQFGNNATAFLVIANMLQTTGLGALNGALNAISDLMVRTGAATVATIEGRFTAYSNQVIGKPAFNESAFDIAFTPSQVYEMALPFLDGCTFDVQSTFPIPANFSLAAQLSGSVASGNFTTGIISGTPVSTTSTSSTSSTTNRDSDSGASMIAASFAAIVLSCLMI